MRYSERNGATIRSHGKLSALLCYLVLGTALCLGAALITFFPKSVTSGDTSTAYDIPPQASTNAVAKTIRQDEASQDMAIVAIVSWPVKGGPKVGGSEDFTKYSCNQYSSRGIVFDPDESIDPYDKNNGMAIYGNFPCVVLRWDMDGVYMAYVFASPEGAHSVRESSYYPKENTVKYFARKGALTVIRGGDVIHTAPIPEKPDAELKSQLDQVMRKRFGKSAYEVFRDTLAETER